ncbi:hypothetical protein O181_098528 [Austropuccinia psidii MF-1]|uniref:Integrase catalytic domain-containing protein n=1 Tax=Austropuccinia psidii MF-1 TaxID=1389203 RepID=A0A9Q3PE89_9BASI|nr:hypothetical protein [Austropuccinia psidii MF-1]
MNTELLFWNKITAIFGAPKIIISYRDPNFKLKFWKNLYDILDTKLAFFTAYPPQTDGLAESILQTMEEIISRFCSYSIKYNDHERYTCDYFTLLQAIQLAYSTSQNATTGNTPSLTEKRWDPLLPVAHLNTNPLKINPTAKDFHYIWKKACPKRIRYSFVGPLAITRLIGRNAVEVKLSEKFSRKNPVFPVSLIKPCHQNGEDKLPSRNKTHSPQDIVEVGESLGPVNEIIKARKMRLNGKDHRQYLVKFKNQTTDKEKLFKEDSIPDGYLNLGEFRASRRSIHPHQL